jgi:hypothetical protein
MDVFGGIPFKDFALSLQAAQKFMCTTAPTTNAYCLPQILSTATFNSIAQNSITASTLLNSTAVLCKERPCFDALYSTISNVEPLAPAFGQYMKNYKASYDNWKKTSTC